MNCACGLPLHYSNPEIRKMVETIIAEQGEFVDVGVGDKKYKVQRHYIALHGIKAADLEHLADLGIVERI